MRSSTARDVKLWISVRGITSQIMTAKDFSTKENQEVSNLYAIGSMEPVDTVKGTKSYSGSFSLRDQEYETILNKLKDIDINIASIIDMPEGVSMMVIDDNSTSLVKPQTTFKNVVFSSVSYAISAGGNEILRNIEFTARNMAKEVTPQ